MNLVTYKKIFRPMLICSLLYFSSACSHQQTTVQTLPIKAIYSSNNCAINQETLKTINSPIELNALLQSMPKNIGQQPPDFPDVDFEKETLIFYAIGQKPSSGYHIELHASDATLKGNKLCLPIQVQQPAAGSAQAQMITSPCSIYSIPRVESSETIIESDAVK
jgi:hypothetical protein